MPTDTTDQEALRLIAFAADRLGRIEGNGECWTLVNNGFQRLGFHKPSSTYVWGRVIDQLSGARPGDVFQFRNFRVRVDTDEAWSEESRGDPRHTAILESIDANGYATFLEANVYGDKNVQRNRFYLKTADLNGDDGRTTVRVSGGFTIYRPQMP